jgi:hypothetical protein
MTRPAYSQSALEAMTVAQLKTIAGQLGAIPDGDKRVKQNWVSAILDRQVEFSPAKVAVQAELLIDRPDSDDDSVETTLSEVGITMTAPSPNPLEGWQIIKPPASSHKSGASIVLIALAAILYTICLVPIGLGIITYRWLRRPDGTIRLFRSRVALPSGIPEQTSIDYFPSPA